MQIGNGGLSGDCSLKRAETNARPAPLKHIELPEDEKESR